MKTEQTTLDGKIVKGYSFAFIPKDWPPTIYKKEQCNSCGW